MDVTDLLTDIMIDGVYVTAMTSDPAFFASHVMSGDEDMTIKVGGKTLVVAAVSAGPDGEVQFRRFS